MPENAAAVTITCPQESYSRVMRIVRDRVDLKSIRVPEVIPKRTRTGVLALLVPGSDNKEKANKITSALRQSLSDQERIWIAHPIRTTELKVKGLIEFMSEEEIKEQISEMRECPIKDIKTGRTQWMRNGLGSV